MTDDTAPTAAQQMLGDFAPALVHFTDDVLFGEVWPRTELTPKERSLVTVASLTTSGSTAQLGHHLTRAVDNGATEDELLGRELGPRPHLAEQHVVGEVDEGRGEVPVASARRRWARCHRSCLPTQLCFPSAWEVGLMGVLGSTPLPPAPA